MSIPRHFLALSVALLASLAVSALLSAPANAEEPLPASAVSSTIKNIGAPKCLDGNEVQDMALVLTFKDPSGAAREVEFNRWQQSTGKACAGVTRGPRLRLATGALLRKESVTLPSKARGGPCWCWYKYYYYDGCIYYQVYDCDWNHCYTARNCD